MIAHSVNGYFDLGCRMMCWCISGSSESLFWQDANGLVDHFSNSQSWCFEICRLHHLHHCCIIWNLLVSDLPWSSVLIYPWALEALDAPDVTFISRRADISGEYTFAGAQMLCTRWCGDSSILQITGRSLDSQTIQHDENMSLLTKIRTSSETTKDNFHVATVCAWIQLGVPIRPPQFLLSLSFPIILPSYFLNSSHLSMVFPMFSLNFTQFQVSVKAIPTTPTVTCWSATTTRGASGWWPGRSTRGTTASPMRKPKRRCIRAMDSWDLAGWDFGDIHEKKTKQTENVWGKYGRCWLMSWHCWHHFLLTKPSAEEREWSLHGVFCNSDSIRRTSDHETKDLSTTCFFWNSFWNYFPSQEFVEEVACVECLHGAMECGCQLSLPCCAQRHSCAWSTSSGPVSELVFTLRVEDRPVTSSWRNPFISYCKARYLIIKQLPSTMYLKALKVTQHTITLWVYNFI